MQNCREWVADMGGQLKSTAVASPKAMLYGVMLLALTSWALVKVVQYLTQPSNVPRTPDIERRGSTLWNLRPGKTGGIPAWLQTFLNKQPASPVSEKPIFRNSFKAPARTPGGLYNHVDESFAADCLQYGSLWSSNGRLLLQLQTGMCTPQHRNLTAHSDMDLITLPWDSGTWIGMSGLVRHAPTGSSRTTN